MYFLKVWQKLAMTYKYEVDIRKSGQRKNSTKVEQIILFDKIYIFF